jgi:hypothetical protein
LSRIISQVGLASSQRSAAAIFAAALAITDLKLHEALLDYGPEAVEGQRILRDAIKNTIAEIWGDRDVDEEA